MHTHGFSHVASITADDQLAATTTKSAIFLVGYDSRRCCSQFHFDVGRYEVSTAMSQPAIQALHAEVSGMDPSTRSAQIRAARPAASGTNNWHKEA